MTAIQRIETAALTDRIKEYLRTERLNVSIQSFNENVLQLMGNVPTYYARQKIQQAIMRIMPKGMRLNDDNITVGSYENVMN
jgi:uncharacterized protein (DUF2164 family)